MKRGSMFLLELLAMILVFSLCATVCVRMIGSSWVISDESERLTEAVYLAESAAARLQGGQNLTSIQTEQGYDIGTEEVSHSDGFRVVHIAVSYEGAPIYELDVTCEEGVS